MKEKKKKSILKRILKWTIGMVLLFLILIVSAPYLFKDKIKELVISNINKNIDATVTIGDIELSFLKRFPLANAKISDILILNHKPFDGDTLLVSDEIDFQMRLTELVKSSEDVKKIQSFSIENAQLNILVNEEGNGNYNLVKKDQKSNEKKNQNSGLSLDIEAYDLKNINFRYLDKGTKMLFVLEHINHSGRGNFFENTLDLKTITKATMSLDYNQINYMNKLNVSLDALLAIDLNTLKFTFKENRALVNQLPLEFQGSIQFVGEEMNQSYQLEFHTPNSSFINLLGVVPKQYAGNLEKVKTTGNFDMKGTLVGILDETTIPTFDVLFVAKNAMFQYPQLPKAVQDIYLDARVINTTGKIENTIVDVSNLSFKIERDVFQAQTSISNLIQNPKINLKANGVINLKHIAQAYPIPIQEKLSGVLRANIQSSFDMESVKKKQYQKIKKSGEISLEGFEYFNDHLANPFFIDKTVVKFNPQTIDLKEFKAKTGETDLDIQGQLNNLYGFLLNKEELKGKFTLFSSHLNVNNFMSKNQTTTSKKDSIGSALKIPSFLNCEFNAKAYKVTYDDIAMTNASGTLFVKDETLCVENLKVNAFQGSIEMNGIVSTKNPKSDFKMNLNLNDLDVKQSFSQSTTLNKILPIAKVIGGKINSNLELNGNLTSSLTPEIKSISGNLLGQLNKTQINAANSKVLSFLGNEFQFIDVNKLNFENVKTFLIFKDGNVVVKPFQIQYQDINITLGGTHGFDQSMNYDVTLDLPAKYLGKEVNNLLGKLSIKQQENLSKIPVRASLTGSFSNPIVKTDIKESTNTLVKKLVEEQKNKLVENGKDKLFNLLNKKNDSTKEKGKDLIKGLLKKKSKKDNSPQKL